MLQNLSSAAVVIGALRVKLKMIVHYSKTCLKQPTPKSTKICFQDRLMLSVSQKYCRMLQVKDIAECSKRAFCNTSNLH